MAIVKEAVGYAPFFHLKLDISISKKITKSDIKKSISKSKMFKSKSTLESRLNYFRVLFLIFASLQKLSIKSTKSTDTFSFIVHIISFL
jgi:hypothetical protein